MSEIKNLNDKWSGRHIGDEIETFLKRLIRQCFNDINSLSSRLAELLGLISSVPKFDNVVVDSLPDISEASLTTVYIVPNNESETSLYDEYMVSNGQWKKIGTQELDPSEYARKEDINNIELLKGISKDEDDELWIERNGKKNPVIHPNLSTQPSILPYRFGVYPVYEVLCPLIRKFTSYTDFDLRELPDDAIIIGGDIIAYNFCVPLSMHKKYTFDHTYGYVDTGEWVIEDTFSDFGCPNPPDYALIRYYRPVYNDDGYGDKYGSNEYGSGDEYDDTETPDSQLNTVYWRRIPGYGTFLVDEIGRLICHDSVTSTYNGELMIDSGYIKIDDALYVRNCDVNLLPSQIANGMGVVYLHMEYSGAGNYKFTIGGTTYYFNPDSPKDYGFTPSVERYADDVKLYWRANNYTGSGHYYLVDDDGKLIFDNSQTKVFRKKYNGYDYNYEFITIGSSTEQIIQDFGGYVDVDVDTSISNKYNFILDGTSYEFDWSNYPPTPELQNYPEI